MFIGIKKLLSPTRVIAISTYLIALHLGAQSAANDFSTPTPANHCPGSFYQLSISQDARLCQIFADQLPASLSYHSDNSPAVTEAFYRAQLTEPSKVTKVKDRILIEYDNRNKIIVISNDDTGSQVDILVTAN
jgi:hypothetical protein